MFMCDAEDLACGSVSCHGNQDHNNVTLIWTDCVLELIELWELGAARLLLIEAK